MTHGHTPWAQPIGHPTYTICEHSGAQSLSAPKFASLRTLPYAYFLDGCFVGNGPNAPVKSYVGLRMFRVRVLETLRQGGQNGEGREGASSMIDGYP